VYRKYPVFSFSWSLLEITVHLLAKASETFNEKNCYPGIKRPIRRTQPDPAATRSRRQAVRYPFLILHQEFFAKSLIKLVHHSNQQHGRYPAHAA
jgi:hypothetical protein